MEDILSSSFGGSVFLVCVRFFSYFVRNAHSNLIPADDLEYACGSQGSQHLQTSGYLVAPDSAICRPGICCIRSSFSLADHLVFWTQIGLFARNVLHIFRSRLGSMPAVKIPGTQYLQPGRDNLLNIDAVIEKSLSNLFQTRGIEV